MGAGDDLRGRARELAEISERLESVADLEGALESAVDRCRALYIARFTDLTPEESETARRMEVEISSERTKRLAMVSLPLMDWFVSSELSRGALFDPFRRAWPRIGVELSKEIARSSEPAARRLRCAILGLFVDGFIVGSALVAARDRDDDFPPESDSLTTPENLNRVKKLWTTAWRRHAAQLVGSGWAALGVVSEPSRREFDGAIESLGVSARKRTKKKLDQATFGYLGAGYSLYRSFTKGGYVYPMDALIDSDFTYQGFAWD